MCHQDRERVEISPAVKTWKKFWSFPILSKSCLSIYALLLGLLIYTCFVAMGKTGILALLLPLIMVPLQFHSGVQNTKKSISVRDYEEWVTHCPPSIFFWHAIHSFFQARSHRNLILPFPLLGSLTCSTVLPDNLPHTSVYAILSHLILLPFNLPFPLPPPAPSLMTRSLLLQCDSCILCMFIHLPDFPSQYSYSQHSNRHGSFI